MTASGAASEPVTRIPTKTEFILRQLRDEIVTGVLPPGEPLLLPKLAARFGTSPIPVREAVRALEVEYLVVVQPHKTAVVAPLPVDELEDVYDIRMLIEAEATRRAVGKLSEAGLSELRSLLTPETPPASLVEGAAAHRRFHFLIYEGAGSPTLINTISRLWDKTERCRMVLRTSHSAPLEPLSTRHQLLYDVVTADDPDSAAEEMRRHIGLSLQALHDIDAAKAAQTPKPSTRHPPDAEHRPA